MSPPANPFMASPSPALSRHQVAAPAPTCSLLSSNPSHLPRDHQQLCSRESLEWVGWVEACERQGKSGLTFEHILNRLQGELRKSSETGTELQSLHGTMSKDHDTLGGSLVSLAFSPIRIRRGSPIPTRLRIYLHTHIHYPPSVPFKPRTHPEAHPPHPANGTFRSASPAPRDSGIHPSPPTSTRSGNLRAY